MPSCRLLALIASLTGACDPGVADQLMVHVVDGSGGALRIPEDVDAFEIRVATQHGALDGGTTLVRYRRTFRLAASRRDATGPAVTLPQSLAVTRAPDLSSGTVRIDVTAFARGIPVQRLHRTVAFGVGRVDVPPFELTPLCFGVECPPDETCGADGRCHGAVGPGEDAGTPPGDAGLCGVGQVQCGTACVTEDERNCGACENACPTGERCVRGTCACGTGLVRCGTACADLATDAAHCGACDTSCAFPHADAACESGACRIAACRDGRTDCNGEPADGCERDLSVDVESCGACGTRCTVSNGTPGCVSGACRIARCNGGRGDCNGTYGDGCETRLDSLTNCGGCGDGCSLSNADETCSSGSCAISSCTGSWGDCNGRASDGCETDLSDTFDDCGRCGARCGTHERCSGGACECRTPDYRGSPGACLPSCGALLRDAAAPRGGISCCPSGCTTRNVGDTWDCAFCCEADVGVNGCL